MKITNRTTCSGYLTDIGAHPLMTPTRSGEVSTRARAGDFAARQQMIEAQPCGSLFSDSEAIAHRGLPLLDLIEEGNLGLIHALESSSRNAVSLLDLCDVVDSQAVNGRDEPGADDPPAGHVLRELAAGEYARRHLEARPIRARKLRVEVITVAPLLRSRTQLLPL